MTAHFQVPAGYTVLGGGPDVGTYDGTTGEWLIGSIPAGGSARFSFGGTVNVTGPYDLTTAITGSSAPDPNPADNMDSAMVTPNRNADLSIELLSAPSGTVAVGATKTLWVRVVNNGPSITSNVTANFQAPPGYTVISGPFFGVTFTAPGTYDAATGEWMIGPMPRSTVVDLTFGAVVNASGSLALTASITGSDAPDPDLTNNVATAPPANRPPVANAGGHQDVGTRSTVLLDGTPSSDADGDPLSFQWSFYSRPANSTAVLSGADTATPSFIADAPGTYTVQLTVMDSHGASSPTATVTVAGSVLDFPPVITSQPGAAGAVGQPYRYDVHASDPDAGDTLTFSLPTAPQGMTIDPATGLIQWTPASNQGGRQAVTVRVQDQGGLFATQSFTVQVSSPANHAPVAADDAYEVRLGESLSVPPRGVLSNDSDADGNPLTATLLSRPTNGSLEFNPDGSFTYTPHTLQTGELVPLDNVNLASRMPGVTITASSFVNGNEPQLATDDDLNTFWRFFGVTDLAPVLDISFPQAVTVDQLQLFGLRDPIQLAQGWVFLSGIFQLFDTNGAVLFESGVVDLPGPYHDATLNIPHIAGVRRVRFTGVPTNAVPGSIAELKVIGSALVQRQAVVPDTNLAQLLPVAVTSSNAFGSDIAENVVDDNANTNWYSDGSGPTSLELAFPVDVTVTGVQTANPSLRPDGFATSLLIQCSGTFQLFDVNGAVLFDSGVVDTPSGDISSASTFTLAVPNVGGVRRVRYTVSGCPGSSFPAGFAEFRVFGSAPVTTPAFDVARKFQALAGRAVHSTTVVANLTDDTGDGRIDADDIPDIVVPVETIGNQVTGEIKAISGDDGRELFTAGGPDLVSPWSEVAVGDLDGDGLPEIVAVHSDHNHLIAFDHTGQLKWVSDANPMPLFPEGPGLGGGAVAIANLDGGPRPHIVVGASVFDADGHLIGDGRTLGGTTAGTGLRSAISAVADLDLDGVPEIIAGPTAYRLANGQLAKVWQRTDRPDGYVAVANFDDDPYPEIVVVAGGQLYMLNHDGGDAAVWDPPTHAPISIPGGLGGASPDQAGPPLIVDVDGDGIPEIGIATAVNYIVFNRDGTLRWKSGISDHSSHSTGSVAFDFDGDGQVEIVYRDEQFLRIFRGADGVLLAKVPLSSSTWAEEPVIADVDNDGHADIVVSSNRFGNSLLTNTGVHVFQDVANQWTRTRRIWNEHSYHITNVNEDGTIPPAETPNWLVSGLNDFRVNAFLPGESPDQADRFTYQATDGSLDSDPATVRITIRTPNGAPQIVSTAPTSAAVGVHYLYGVQASDPDAGDVLTFSLPTSPAGMTIDASFGLIQWTPTSGQLGTQLVVVKVQDVHGAFALQQYSVQVGNPATVPNVVGQTQSDAGTAISGAGLALGSTTNQNSPTLPAGTVINQNPTGGTQVAPGAAVNLFVSIGRPPPGTVPNVVGEAQAAAQTDITASGFALGTVNSQNSTTVPFGIVIGQTPAAGTAATSGSAVNIVVSSGPPPGDVDQDGDGYTPDQGDCDDADPGIYPGAFDAPGDGIDQNCNGVDSVAGDSTPPTASIEGPADLAVVTMPTDITGTANDENFLRYTLELSRPGDATGTVIGSGAASIVNEVLGRLDPTLLENGLYSVRLIAEDTNGQVTTDDKVFRVDGSAKPGILALSFMDMQVPVAGIPITVVRSYDSRVKAQRDFGTGWSLRLTAGTYQSNRPPGEGWVINDLPILGRFLPCIGGSTETRSHLTEIRLSDRESYTFALTVTNGNLGITDACEGVASFRFIDGTTPDATLDILDGTGVIYVRGGSDVVLDRNAFLDGRERPYEPQRVRLTTIDGRRVELDRRLGITAIEDPNGNQLSISSAGVVHSGGKSIAFSRDAAGRIARITGPLGNTLDYSYDGRGDLTAFRDAEANVTTFIYDADHNLIEIHDPLGNRTMKNEYDSDGRLVAVIDADGKRVELTHDILARQETIRDRAGHVTVQAYDDRGNITSSTDPLGNTTTRTYDDKDHLLSMTDPLGDVQTYGYDGRGNLLTQGDALGNVFSFAYDPAGRVVSVTDPAGFGNFRRFDAQGNLTRSTDALGVSVDYAYDGMGDLTSATDTAGRTLTIDYDAQGNATRQSDATGRVSSFTYDAMGNQVTQSTSRTDLEGNTVSATLQFAFSPQTRVIGATDSQGRAIAFAYDADGLQAAVHDRDGRALEYEHDALGRRILTRYPDSTTEAATYDANGNRSSATDRLGRTSHFEYDALNRLTRVNLPDGSTTATEYDAVGQVTAKVDEAGNRTQFVYDAAGRRTKIIDARGGETAYAYDARGEVTAVTDANGHTTTFDYNGNGRMTRVTFPDGTSRTASYDPIAGHMTITDRNGRMTQFKYDDAGRLTRVIDPLNGQTVYTYDEVGDRIGVTNAKGEVTRWAYDDNHRVVRHTLPLGMSETFTYDSNGNVLSRTDFDGRTTTYTYSATGRLETKTYPDGTGIAYTYTQNDNVATITDARGVTEYTYDDRDRLTQVTDPNGMTIRYGYDSRGNRVSVHAASGTTLYAYDELNRMSSVTDASGGTTRYTYDAVGHRALAEYPNGTQTQYGYDSNGRLIALTNVRADSSVISSYTYTLGSAGEVLEVTDDSGRHEAYTYDALYRLVREDVTDPGLGDESFQYTYDAVGNRLAAGSSDGTLTFSYDANDRLLSDGVRTYTYDPNGNLLSAASDAQVVAYTYDFDDRLTQAASPSSTSTYVYDADGVRVAGSVNDVVTNYVVDRSGPLSTVVEEREAGGALRVRYEYGAQRLSQWRGGVPSYYVSDGHGSTRQLTDGSGAITDTYTYDAFGGMPASTGSTPNSYRFAGEEADGSTGLYYLRARYYSPLLGRFLTTDPLRDTIGDPLTLHKYVYCGDDPVNCIDPSGKTTLIEEMSTVAISGILTSVAWGIFNTGEILYYLSGSHAFVPLTPPDATLYGFVGGLSAGAVANRIPGAQEVGLALSLVSGVGGAEVLTGSSGNLVYAFIGGSVGIGGVSLNRPALGLQAGGSPNPLFSAALYSGRVWNMKDTKAYEGWFLSLAGSRLMELFPFLPLNATIFTGPDNGAAYGYSQNRLDSSVFRPSTGLNISTARTYYWFVDFTSITNVAPPSCATDPAYCGPPVAGPRG